MSLLNDGAKKVVLALLSSPRPGTYLQLDLKLSGGRVKEITDELKQGGFISARDSVREPYTLTRAGEELASLYVQFTLLTNINS